MSKKFVGLSILLVSSLAIPTSAVSLFATPERARLTESQDKKKEKDTKDKKEIGSEKKTGGPTQKDKDTMDDIHKGSKDLKDRIDKEKKERDKQNKDKQKKEKAKHKKD